MFKPERMKYLRVILLTAFERDILKALGHSQIVQLTHGRVLDASPNLPPLHDEEIALCNKGYQAANELLNRFSRQLTKDDILPLSTTPAKESTLSITSINAKIESIQKEFEAVEKAIQEKQNRRNAIKATVGQLSSFKDLSLPISQLSSFSFLHFSIGSIETAKLPLLSSSLDNNAVLLAIPRENERTAIIAATSRTGRFALQTELEKAAFKAETIDLGNNATIEQAIESGKTELEKTTTEEATLQLTKKEIISAYYPILKGFIDAALRERKLYEAEGHFSHTDKTVQLQGWIPEKESISIKETITTLTRGTAIIELLSPEDVPELPIPVLLKNNPLLKPFELLIQDYGLPGYNDLEPTLFVAITYMLMFGMMFGDLGHGLVLALGGIIALFTTKVQKTKDISIIVTLAGISSMVFGIIYGSCFGLRSFHKYALWHDPLDGNPLDLMKVAICAGVLIISTGIILNVINRIRKGDWGGAFFSSFGVIGALFYWGTLGLLLKSALLTSQGTKWLIFALVVIVPIVAWALYEPIKLARNRNRDKEETIGAAIMEGAIQAFETVLSYMSSTISFVRLAAYAMSHAAVLMATFLMADGISKADPTGIGSMVIIIIGNLIAIGLEGLIAAIQALRLEHYEFFGKFFAGDGERFTPFKL